MKKLTLEDLALVIGGVDAPGQDQINKGEQADTPGPDEAEGDKNQVGALEHVDTTGPDQV
jgi:hypothetical protein